VFIAIQGQVNFRTSVVFKQSPLNDTSTGRLWNSDKSSAVYIKCKKGKVVCVHCMRHERGTGVTATHIMTTGYMW